MKMYVHCFRPELYDFVFIRNTIIHDNLQVNNSYGLSVYVFNITINRLKY
jgi:hypothetical protein